MDQPFQTGDSATIAQTNATSSAGGSLPDSASQVVLYNSSTTDVVFWACRVLNSPADAGPTAVIPVGSTLGGIPIAPGAQIRLTVGRGPKKYATIATAADGTLYISPGEGN